MLQTRRPRRNRIATKRRWLPNCKTATAHPRPLSATCSTTPRSSSCAMKVGVNAIERKRDSAHPEIPAKRPPSTPNSLARFVSAQRGAQFTPDGMLNLLENHGCGRSPPRPPLRLGATSQRGSRVGSPLRQRTRLSYMCGQPPRCPLSAARLLDLTLALPPNQRLVTSRAQPSAILLNPHIGKTFSSAVCFPFFRALFR